MIYKSGDRVKVIGGPHSHIIGKTGTVRAKTELTLENYVVQFEDSKINKFDSTHSYVYVLHDRWFELAFGTVISQREFLNIRRSRIG